MEMEPYVCRKELPYHAGTITFIQKHTTSDMSTPEERGKNKNGNIYLWMWKKF